MACEKREVVINDRAVTIVQWPASTAVKRLRSILDVFKGDAIPLVQDEWDFLVVLRCQQQEGIDEVIQEIMSSGVFINDTELNQFNFDVVFSGDMMFLWKVISKVLEVNYKDFFTKGFELNKPEQTT